MCGVGGGGNFVGCGCSGGVGCVLCISDIGVEVVEDQVGWGWGVAGVVVLC